MENKVVRGYVILLLTNFENRVRQVALGETHIYNLKAVISHFGPIDSGHYVCFSKRGDHVSLLKILKILIFSPVVFV